MTPNAKTTKYFCAHLQRNLSISFSSLFHDNLIKLQQKYPLQTLCQSLFNKPDLLIRAGLPLKKGSTISLKNKRLDEKICLLSLLSIKEKRNGKRRRCMSIPYRLFQRRDPNNPDNPKKWYGFVKSNGRYPLHKLAERISSETTISTADVYAVLIALLDVIPKILSEGFVVVLGELGYLRTTIKTKGVENKKDFTQRNIIGRKIIFKPGTMFADAVKEFEFKKKK
jgi:predicted histone-like DNA-binding protein